MTPLHTLTPHPSPWLCQWSRNFEKLFALVNFWIFSGNIFFRGSFKEQNTPIGLLVVDSCSTAVKLHPGHFCKQMTKMWPMKKFPNSFQLLRVFVSAASRPGQPPNLRLIQPNYTALITAAEGSHPLFSSYNWGPGQKLWDDEARFCKVVCSNFVKNFF